MLHFSQLPDDLVVAVLQWLCPDDLIRVERVDKRMRACIANNDKLWCSKAGKKSYTRATDVDTKTAVLVLIAIERLLETEHSLNIIAHSCLEGMQPELYESDTDKLELTRHEGLLRLRRMGNVQARAASRPGVQLGGEDELVFVLQLARCPHYRDTTSRDCEVLRRHVMRGPASPGPEWDPEDGWGATPAGAWALEWVLDDPLCVAPHEPWVSQHAWESDAANDIVWPLLEMSIFAVDFRNERVLLLHHRHTHRYLEHHPNPGVVSGHGLDDEPMETAEIPTRGVCGRDLPLFRKRHILVDPSTARIVSTQLSFVAAPSRLGSGQPVAQAAASHALDIRALRFTGFRTDLEPRTYMHLPSMGNMGQLIMSPQELLHALNARETLWCELGCRRHHQDYFMRGLSRT